MNRITRNFLEKRLEDEDGDLEMINEYLEELRRMMKNAKTTETADELLPYLYKTEGLKDAVLKKQETIKELLMKRDMQRCCEFETKKKKVK